MDDASDLPRDSEPGRADAPPKSSRRLRLRRPSIGIRARVVVWYLVLFAALAAVSVVTIHQVLVTRMNSSIDQTLQQEVEELRRLSAGANPTTDKPFGSDPRPLFEAFLNRNVPQIGEAFFAVVDGKPYASSAGPPYDLFRKDEVVAEWSAVTDSTYGRTSTSQGPARWLAVPVREQGGPKGVFVVAQFYGSTQDDITNATRVVAGVIGATLLLATLLGWLAAGRALAPIGRLNRAARRAGIDDLTERIPVGGDDEVARLTETFNDLLARLESSVTMQRQFVSDMGHDLRTPITIVRGQLELLPEDPSERASVVALCIDELDRMSRYVRDLSLLASASQPDFLNLGPVDLAALTDGMAQRARGLDDQRDWVIDAASTAVVEGDNDRITRAWLNLAANAVAHTPPGTPVHLGSSVGPEGVRLWVADRGAGITEDERARIFERFERVGDSREQRPDGMGLGLAIVRAITLAHGGRATVEPNDPTGAVFAMTMPLTVIEPERGPEASPATAPQTPAGHA